MKTKIPVIVSIIFIMGIFLITNLAKSENTDIVITEICPTGCAGSGYQWIEIFNKGETAVDLENWKFWEAETNHGLNIAPSSTQQDFLIEPGEYAIITQNDLYFFENNQNVTSTVLDSSWSTLNKSGELIGLKDEDGIMTEEFTYKQIENYSLERKDVEELIIDEDNWQEHLDSNSVGQENYWKVDDTNTDDTEDNGGTEDDDADDTENTEGEEEDDNDEDSEEESTGTNTTSTLVINEFVSNPNDGENEWAEIYNNSTTSIDLTGWTMSDGVGVFASPTGTVQAEDFFVIEWTASKLNNGGDILILKNGEEEIIDQVCFGDWVEGCLSDAVSSVEKGNSTARIVDGQDTNNDRNDFAETTSSTKGLENIIIAPVVETPTPTSGGGGGSSSPVVVITYNPSDIVINELVSDPTDGGEEFVELYNNTASTISLSGWWVEDGSESKTNLEGNISAHGFFTIEKPKGNLNNSGDIVILFSVQGKEIDRVTYGTWDDGNVNDNAPSVSDPLSLIRKVDGQDSDNNYYDFVLTSTVTKNKANQISIVTEDGEVLEQILTSAKIVINEVVPNPTGSDSEDEWVELKNLGSETVSLVGWSLGDATSKKYKIKQGGIKPGGFIVFKRLMTSIAFNNTGGDEVKLYGPSGALLDNIKYTGSAGEAESYARREDNSWDWTIKTTPGVENILEGKSAAPKVSIDVDTEVAEGEPVLFDASDTTDPEGEEMSFTWDFGDGGNDEGDVVEHRFLENGIFTVKLTVVDSAGNEAKSKVIITVKNRFEFSGGYLSSDEVSGIEISEFIPNPEGSDTTEFIELFNPTDNDIDLSDFKLDDEEGGSRGYGLPARTIIPAGEYVVFGRQDTKLALNNTNDSVRLLFPDGTILLEIKYDDVVEGSSYVRNAEDIWIWTGTPTPGKENIVSVPKASVASVSVSRSKRVKPIIYTTLEKVRDEDVGDKVKLTGVVAVEPGVLATQYFYIVGSPGVQVYMYKKDFPNLKVGDRIEITGEISESYGNTRVKLSSKDDIVKIDHPGDPQAKTVEIAEIGEQLEGWLAEVNGEITELKGSYMYVDDGTEEVKVYFKRGTGINRKVLQVGDIVSVKGLVAQTKSGYQLLPRAQTDIEKTGVAESMVTKIENTEEENKQEVAEKYLTATAGGLTSILFGLFAKAKGNSAVNIVKKLAGIGVAVIRRKP